MFRVSPSFAWPSLALSALLLHSTANAGLMTTDSETSSTSSLSITGHETGFGFNSFGMFSGSDGGAFSGGAAGGGGSSGGSGSQFDPLVEDEPQDEKDDPDLGDLTMTSSYGFYPYSEGGGDPALITPEPILGTYVQPFGFSPDPTKTNDFEPESDPYLSSFSSMESNEAEFPSNPEPGSLCLMALGMGILGSARLKYRRT